MNEKEENYYKPVRASNFWSNLYIEYESNSYRKETLLIEEYLNTTWSYLNDINYLRKTDEWIIQSIRAINLVVSKGND